MKSTLSFSNSILKLKTAETFKYSEMATALAKKGMEIISFGIGQPDFNTPKHIVNAAIKALRKGFTRYVSPPGIPELRSEIARYVSRFTGARDVEPKETMVLPGTKSALFFAITSYIKNGDEVIIPDPGFYSYNNVTRYVRGKPVFLPLREENHFSMTAENVQAAITNRTKMIILNSPHNPTGGMLTKSEVKGILELAKDKEIIVVSDEVYDHYTYENEFNSVLTDPDWRDFVVYVNGLSKTYSMTGWRIGYLVADKEAIKRFTLLVENTFSCATSFVQKAGVAALEGPQEFFSKILEDYKKRRDFIYSELNQISGVKAVKPAGAFYIFPNIKEILKRKKLTTEEFAMRLLKERGIVVLPGSSFPSKAGEGYLRLSYALPIETIRKGIERFKVEVEEGLL